MGQCPEFLRDEDIIYPEGRPEDRICGTEPLAGFPECIPVPPDEPLVSVGHRVVVEVPAQYGFGRAAGDMLQDLVHLPRTEGERMPHLPLRLLQYPVFPVHQALDYPCKGDIVTLQYRKGSVVLQTLVTALQDADRGEAITVQGTNTKKIRATVVSSKEVAVE